jgi:molecular chaperone DnaK
VVTVEQFTEGLKISGLMTEKEVHALLVSLPPDMTPPSVENLAAELVRRGKLTKYQAGRIASGRPHGLVLGKYVIQDKIGEGGMGEVFIAEHLRMKRPVVVKILPEAATKSEYSLRRFEREVEAAAQLSHPNIVTAFDADEAEGIHFLVMEYVAGEPLGDLVSRRGPMSVGQAISCVLQAARGLQYAHAKGIIHRDIKPNNLLLDEDGVVKILDMGLARFEDPGASVKRGERDALTGDHQIVGTIEYMSPEQVEDSSNADPRSDIYSLGCTLFRLLTNRPPYQGDTLVRTLLAHRMDPVPSLCAEREDVPASLQTIFCQMVAKSPDDRYQTAGDLIQDLLMCLERESLPVTVSIPLDRREADGEVSDDETTVIDAEVQLDLASNESTTNVRGSEDTKIHAGSAVLQEIAGVVAPAVGIDLGTTFSAIAHLDDVGRPQVLANLEGDKTTPSVVLMDGRDVIVGKEASKAMATDMEYIAECAKRDLGHRAYHSQIAGEEFPPEVIQAWVLDKLRKDARGQLGDFRKVVITVPAYFDEVRRKATQDAGYIAGLDVLDIINEPTAAALAFGFQQNRLFIGDADDVEPTRVLVYDLGGGTFDVTIMEIGSGEFVTLATDGDMQLGGRDWDQRLVDFVAEAFIRKHGLDPRIDPNARGRLLRDCEDAKRTLSARHKTFVTCDFGGHADRVEITREQFEDMTRDLLERTAFTTRHVLQTADMQWSQIDRVLMVGGSTRMPAVVEMLRKVSGKEPDVTISPDEAVAQGAAIHAGLLLDRLQGRPPRVRVRNVNSHSLGVVATDPKTTRKQTAFLIPRNTPLPAKAKRVFKTLKDGQKSIMVQIVEGESSDPSGCTQIGKCTVRDLPKDLPAGTPIEVRFQYRQNGRLRVSVNVAGTGKNVTHDIRRANNLTREAMDEWRQRISGLPPDRTGDSSERI